MNKVPGSTWRLHMALVQMSFPFCQTQKALKLCATNTPPNIIAVGVGRNFVGFVLGFAQLLFSILELAIRKIWFIHRIHVRSIALSTDCSAGVRALRSWQAVIIAAARSSHSLARAGQ